MTDLFRYLADKIDEDLKAIEGDLALGKASDISEYKFACGRYRGLLTAKNHIIEAAQRMREDDDEF